MAQAVGLFLKNELRRGNASDELGLVTSHLATQRAAIKMLHERIVSLVGYVASVISGSCIYSIYSVIFPLIKFIAPRACRLRVGCLPLFFPFT